MAANNNLDTLNGLFKETYADKMHRLIPEGTKLLPRVPFLSKDRQPGNNYHQPVVLGMEHGVTFADSGEGAFNLNAPVAGQIKDATVRGYQLVLRSVLSYSAASRAAGPGQHAFEDATKFLVKNMLDSVNKKLEIELLYGQMGYGTVASVSALVITVTTAEWAPGIWAGAEGMPVEIRSAAGVLRGESKVSAVSLSGRTITLEAMPAGVIATDVIWHKGAYGKEFAGIHKIFTNTGSLFGISATDYNLWKANEFPAGSTTLSFSIVQQAISKGVEKGLDSDVVCLVNPGHWDNLLTEQAAFRMYDSSYKSGGEVENGGKSIKFYGQNGAVEIIPSIYVKEGYAYVIALEDMVRVGSTDVTFKRPGQGDNFLRDMEDAAGYELRCYTDQALFCAKPGRQVIISGLTI